jgi:hypothetical protein
VSYCKKAYDGKRPTITSNKLVLIVDESENITGINISPMAAAIKPYSMAVAPLVSRTKSFARHFTFFIVATLHRVTFAITPDLNPDLFSEC